MAAKLRRLRTLGDIMSSPEMVEILEGINASIRANVSDPNPQVAATLRSQVFMSSGGRSAARAVGQVGMAPWLRGVEARRGPIARALGSSRGA